MISYGTKKEATVAARKVRNMLFTKGWQLRIWKNCGRWFYELHKGTVNLYNQGDGFTTLMNLEEAGTGHPDLSAGAKVFKNPNTAYIHQLSVARKFSDKVRKAIERSV